MPDSHFKQLKAQSTQQSHMQFSLPIEPPSYINVLKSYPTADKLDYMPIPTQIIEKQYGFTYSNAYTMPHAYFEHAIAPELETVERNINKSDCRRFFRAVSTDNFALYNFGDKKGIGLFYVGDAPLPAMSVCGVYAGEMIEMAEQGSCPYAMPIGSSDDFMRDSTISKQNIGVTAKNTGNLTRFINDAVQEEEFDEEYELAFGVDKSQVQFTNVAPYHHPLTDWLEACLLITIRDIAPGEQLLFPYGEAYWAAHYAKQGIDRALFQADGAVMPAYLYRRTKITIRGLGKEGIDFTTASAEQALGQVALQRPMLIVSDINNPSSGRIGIATPAKIARALRRFGYSDIIPTREFGFENEFSSMTSTLSILRDYVTPDFLAIKRQSPSDPLDFTIDVVFDGRNEKIRKAVTDALAGKGAFLNQFMGLMMIPAINDIPNSYAIARIPKSQPALSASNSGFFKAKVDSNAMPKQDAPRPS